MTLARHIGELPRALEAADHALRKFEEVERFLRALKPTYEAVQVEI